MVVYSMCLCVALIKVMHKIVSVLYSTASEIQLLLQQFQVFLGMRLPACCSFFEKLLNSSQTEWRTSEDINHKVWVLYYVIFSTKLYLECCFDSCLINPWFFCGSHSGVPECLLTMSWIFTQSSSLELQFLANDVDWMFSTVRNTLHTGQKVSSSSHLTRASSSTDSLCHLRSRFVEATDNKVSFTDPAVTNLWGFHRSAAFILNSYHTLVYFTGKLGIF